MSHRGGNDPHARNTQVNEALLKTKRVLFYGKTSADFVPNPVFRGRTSPPLGPVPPASSGVPPRPGRVTDQTGPQALDFWSWLPQGPEHRPPPSAGKLRAPHSPRRSPPHTGQKGRGLQGRGEGHQLPTRARLPAGPQGPQGGPLGPFLQCHHPETRQAAPMPACSTSLVPLASVYMCSPHTHTCANGLATPTRPPLLCPEPEPHLEPLHHRDQGGKPSPECWQSLCTCRSLLCVTRAFLA